MRTIRIIWILFLALFNVPLLFAQELSSPWQKDLSELVANIKKYHPNPFTQITGEEFLKSVDNLGKHFNTDSIGNQIKMLKLVSLLRDRHTALYPNDAFKHWLPLSIYNFENGFYIISTTANYKGLLGAKIISFENSSASDVFEKTADLHSSDNDYGRKLNTYYMSNMDVLKYYDIVKNVNKIKLTVLLANGEQKDVNMESLEISRDLHIVLDHPEMFGPMDQNKFPDYYFAYKDLNVKDYYNLSLEDKKDIPHFIRNRKGYWYEYLMEYKTMYIAICYSTNNSRNGFEDFSGFLREVFYKIDTNPIEKVVLDIRFNPGGDGSITLPLVHEFIKRDSINKKGKLFTLIGRKTYSAAQMIYASMLRHTNTLLVGEPAGAPVNGFGDPSSFTLENTKMNYQISTLYWQMGHPNDTSRIQKIDIPFVFNGKDYVNGKDRALDYILTLDGDFLTLPKILAEKSIDDFQKEYGRRKKEFGRYNWWNPFDEGEMRYTSRNLFDDGFVERAYVGFEALLEMYPNSWRGYRDYAERRIKANDINKAKELIIKGLNINPTSTDLKELLKNIKT